MNMKKRRPGGSRLPALMIPALLALLPGAQAQTAAPPAGAAPAAVPSTVVVSGVRDKGSSSTINEAKDRILNGKSASSCAFMDTYNSAKNDVMTKYMSDFGLENDMSNDVEKFSVYAPDGDVSNMKDSSGIESNESQMGSTSETVKGCGARDRREAAARMQIARKDRSLGQAYEAYDRADYAKAFELFTTAYNKVGYEEAAIMLGRLNLYGSGTPKNPQKAVDWLDKVANGRFDAAQDVVKFDPKDPSAMTPKAEAAFMLARIYERGIGVPADKKQALRWYAKAVDYGFLPAQDILGRALIEGKVERNAAKGVELLKTAGEAGYLPAAYHLAQAYHEGEGVPQDYKQAVAWFGAAAKAGMPAAMFAAGRMYDLGEGVPADPNKALVLYKDAALRGNRDAQFALGTYFYTGEVVGKKDPAVARQWFEAAAKQGQPDAMFNLGAMMSGGEGGAKDPALAYVWFSLAEKAGYEGATAALRTLGPRLTTADRGRADAILKPPAVH
jgi:TPR repeat protein